MTGTLSPLVIEVAGVPDVTALADSELLALQRSYGAARRQVDAGSSVLAAEVARRSHHDLGYSGLAQRQGARTPEKLIASVTGLSVPESRAMIAAGAAADAPWMGEVTSALQQGDVSVGATAAILAGLGTPSADVDADALLEAAREVLEDSGTLPPEQVARRAREKRDELDEAGVLDREKALRDKRFLRLTPQDDGMTRIFGLLDPESAALVTDAFDLVTSPRRGGPRFVDEQAKAKAQRIIDDPRTTEQITLDAFVEMVRIAGAADTGRVFGVRKPSVRVHITQHDLERGKGLAHIEGQTAAISVQTADRIGCSTGYLPIVFDEDDPLNLGRAQRLFTEKQRVALAAAWGGCAIDGCDRPPSWTEAHHADEWERDSGDTDVRNGILLCKHHHMWLHDTGARITRNGDQYLLHVPGREPVTLETKNPIRQRERRRRAA